MTTKPPITVSEPEWDRGLWWMVLASGGLHLLAIGLLLLMPQSFLHHPPPLQSYTVDLVAPDKVGGTNMVRGGKGRVAAPPVVAAPKEEPKPPPPKVEVKPPEPPKPPPQEVVKPAPPPEPPKVEEKPKDDELALAEKTVAPPPPTVAPAPPTAPAAPTAPPTPTIDVDAAKAAADAKAAKAAADAKAAKDAADAKAAKAVADAKAAKAAADAKAAKDAADAKVVKAAADAKAAKAAADAKAAKDAAEAKVRDARIAAAVKRVGESQTGALGGGTGTKPGEQGGGSISVGPGEGSGGIVMGVEYLLYYNMLQSRIKQSWAWAGTNQSLEAVVRFNITDSGEVTNVRITHSSGDASFDASAERAVRTLNPLPPPPEKYRKQFADVEVPFSLAQLQQ